MAAIFVANVLRYKQEGWRPDRDLILALTADEEGGDANGVQWLHRRIIAELIDAAYAINEGGGGTLDGTGPGREAAVPLDSGRGEGLHRLHADDDEHGGHSSVPRPDNAIYRVG